MHRFDFDLPSDVLGRALTMLGHVRATPRETDGARGGDAP